MPATAAPRKSPPDDAVLPATPAAARAVELVTYPDPRLRRKCRPVKEFDGESREVLAALVARMFEVMREAEGVGLAAPQVGVLARVFVVDAHDGREPRAYVNPRLLDAEGECEGEEGCLSLPDIRTPVHRSERLRIEARDVVGEPFAEEAGGLTARIWQHEADHLNGVLILDKMPPSEQMAHKKALRSLEEKYAKSSK